jgi:hypothetical protein
MEKKPHMKIYAFTITVHSLHAGKLKHNKRKSELKFLRYFLQFFVIFFVFFVINFQSFYHFNTKI